jgi:branched-chain amino acid transport system permease protein
MKLNRWTIAFLVIGLLLVLPIFGGSYLATLVFITLMYIVLSLSYDIMGGITGYLNFAHCTFFGVSAYTFGILYLRKFPLVFCFVLPVLVVLAYAAFISFPLFRIRGVYFGLASIGLVKLVEQLALNFRNLTGGSGGLTIPSGDQLYLVYYMTVVLAVLCLYANYRILRSRFGLALTSIREDEAVAQSSGINSYIYKAMALMISSAFAALMGAIYMFYITYIVPESVFGLELVFSPAIMAMLGGTGTLFGPIVGALFITLLQEILWTKLAYLHLAIYGSIFAMVGFFMPGGILREPKVQVFFNRAARLFNRG